MAGTLSGQYRMVRVVADAPRVTRREVRSQPWSWARSKGETRNGRPWRDYSGTCLYIGICVALWAATVGVEIVEAFAPVLHLLFS